jgi:tetratricopeptide (TPR) repeat protein
MANKDNKKAVDNMQQLTSTESFFDRNRKFILIGLVGIVVVVIGYFGYKKLVSEPHAEESQDAYWNAFYEFENGDTTGLAIDGNEYFMGFAQISEEYAGTPGGNIATYALGIDAMEKGEFEVALGYFEEVEFEDVMVGTLVIGLMGDCYVELGQYEEAAVKFEEAAVREANEYTSPMFYKKAGLVYQELGQNDKAVIAYQKIKDDWAASMEAQDIDKYIIRAQN